VANQGPAPGRLLRDRAGQKSVSSVSPRQDRIRLWKEGVANLMMARWRCCITFRVRLHLATDGLIGINLIFRSRARKRTSPFGNASVLPLHRRRNRGTNRVTIG